MLDFGYYMPTKIFFGKGSLSKISEILNGEGKKALIVTGKSSSRKNGSLNDVIRLMDQMDIEYLLFDEVQENPPLDMVERAASIARNEKVEFIVAIGGGSALDSAKGIAVLAKNSDMKARDLFGSEKREGLSVVAIPTTSGTGSEVTQYAIFTDHEKKTKRNFSQRIFPKYAVLDPEYTNTMPDETTVNTAIDALSHLVEGYMASNANQLSDALAEKGFGLFGKCVASIRSREFTYEDRENLMLCSMIAGMVIAQAGTSLPHGMGYALTYFHSVEHGRANGILLKAYLDFCSDRPKVDRMMNLMGFDDIDEFDKFIKASIDCSCEVSLEQIEQYAKEMMKNKGKLKNHPQNIEEEDIFNIYKHSLML